MISIYLDIKVFIIKFHIGDNARLNEFSSHLWTPGAYMDLDEKKIQFTVSYLNKPSW